MARQTRPFQEQFQELDPYQQDAVAAMFERYGAKLPKGPSAEELAAAAAAKERGSVWNTMKRGMWRGMENLSRYGQGAAWLPIQLLKLPGSIDEAVSTPERGLSDLVTGSPGTYKPGFWGKVKRGAENIERELQDSTAFFQENAGVPKAEQWYPTGERLLPKWVPETVGTFTQPGPYLSPIKKLMSKEAIAPALKGMAQMGTYSGAVSGMEEFNKPADQRDWANVPTNAVIGGALSPLFQRFAGAFERNRINPAKTQPGLASGKEKVLLDIPKETGMTTAPPPPTTPRPPVPPSRQITDFVDVPFESIKSTGDLPYIPTKPLEYKPPQNPTIHAPGPVATGPGHVIQMPGPTVDEAGAKKLLEEASQAALAARTAPKQGPPVAADVPFTATRANANPAFLDSDFVRGYQGRVEGMGRPSLEPDLPQALDIPSGTKGPSLLKRSPDKVLPPPPVKAGPMQGPPPLESYYSAVYPSPVEDVPTDFLRGYQGPIAGIGTPDPLDFTVSFAQGKAPVLTKVPVEDSMPLLKSVERGLPQQPAPSAPIAPGKVYGQSLTDFLSEHGGVLDQGSELSRLEMNRPFKKGLIKRDGMGLDTAAEVAYESGYLENRDIHELLGKLDQESRGIPQFAKGVQKVGLEDQLFEQQFRKERPWVDPNEAEFALTPDEPLHPSDLPDEFLPPLEDVWPDPTFAPRASGGAAAHTELGGASQTAGRPSGANPSPTPDLPDRFHALAGPGPTPVPHEAAPPTPDLPAGGQAAQEVSEEVAHDTGAMGKLADLLNDERGSVKIGGGVGPIERVLTQRRFAEKHPDFAPVYQQALDRFEWASAQKYDLHQLGRPYFLLDPKDRKTVDTFLRSRRRGQPGNTVPPALQPAVDAVDRMMGSAWQLTNDVRATKGLPPIAQDPNYVPFARSGDFLTIGQLPTGQKWVSASPTLREAERIMRQQQGLHPQGTWNVKHTAAKKGDLPALDFGTLAQLERAGFIDRTEFDQIVTQFDLPPGFSAHFRNAQKILGESVDLLDPIERYLDGVTNYAGRFLYDDPMKALIAKISDPAVRQYAEHYRDYLNTKPQEYSRLRGGVAVWDLALNVGSIFQNATQVPLLGIPTLHERLGSLGAAVSVAKDAAKTLFAIHDPRNQRYATMLHRAEREGHVRPVNAEELFGARGVGQQELQFGSPYVQRQMDKGWLPPAVGSALRTPLDLAAEGVETLLSKGGDVSLDVGQRVSYALHRLTGSSAPIAKDKATAAHPILMQGFAALEELNRKTSLLMGYKAAERLGMGPDEAYAFAKQYSRDVNFDYSPASRAQAFRGKGAPLGLFMTFQTEYMASISRMLRQQVNDRKLWGPATSALAGFLTIAGMKGVPGMEDFDLYGPTPGVFSENLPEWAWHGPVSAITGKDVAAKFKVGPRIPYDLLNGSLDLSQIPVAQPFANIGQGTGWFLDSPMDAPSAQKYIERMAPPSVRHALQAGRWAGWGPAGEIEQGTVGTLRGHTPGPTADGTRDFFRPDAYDIAGKALTFTPLALSQQYTRGRIQQRLQDQAHRHTTTLMNTVAHHLDRNGEGVPSPAMDELRRTHPKAFAGLMKAHQRRQSGAERGSTEEIYRKAQEPKVIPR